MEGVNRSQSIQAGLGEVMNDLQRGLDTASYLDMLIQDRSGSNAQILIEEIKGCFSRSITTLDSSNLCSEFVNQLQISSASSQNISIQSNPTRSRPRVGAVSPEKLLLENPDDCHAWRIFWQKETKNSKYPRLYYECAHKDELNCCVTKTVLRMEEDPSMYEIGYSGEHTCMPLLNEQEYYNSLISIPVAKVHMLLHQMPEGKDKKEKKMNSGDCFYLAAHYFY